MPFSIKLALVLSLVGTMAAAGSWTTTTSNGGSGSGSYSCERGDNSVTCNGTASFTDRNGYTRSWDAQRIRTQNSVTVTRDVTRRNGSRASFSRTRNR